MSGTRYAWRTLYPCTRLGVPESGRRIDPGDKLRIGAQTGEVYEVTYPVKSGTRQSHLRTLAGTAACYNQHDYGHVPYPAPGYLTATVKSGGCGPTCMAMAVETLRPEISFDPAAAALFAQGCGARVSGGTNMATLCKRACERFSLTVQTSSVLSELRAHLASGGIAIANAAGNGMLSTGGHYVLVLGEDGGRLVVADPGYYAGKYGARYPKRKAAVRVQGSGNKVILTLAPAVLDADCRGRSPRYYLLKG